MAFILTYKGKNVARNKSDNEYRNGVARRGFFGRFFLSEKDKTGSKKSALKKARENRKNIYEKMEVIRMQLDEVYGGGHMARFEDIKKESAKKIGSGARMGNIQKIEIRPDTKETIADKTPEGELVTLSEIAKESVYSREYLGYLVRQKKLKAGKVDGEWRTTRKGVKEFSDKAEENKRKLRQNLSQKLGKEKKQTAFPDIRLKYPRISFRHLKPMAVLGILIFFFAMASLVNADLSNWRDETVRKVLATCDLAIEKVAENFPETDEQLAYVIHGLKVGTDKINSFTNTVIGRKKVNQYEKTAGLSIRGSGGEKENLARSEEETMGGIVAGEESSLTGSRRGLVLAETTGTLLSNTGPIEDAAYVVHTQSREVPNGEYDVRFSLYSLDRAETDPYPSDTDQASRIWEETQKVKIQNGLLTTYLGGANPIPTSLNFANQIYYFATRVGEDAELIPRKNT